MTKTATPATVVPGQTTTYTVTVRNDGPSDAVNVLATDTVSDPNLALTSATAPGATCTVTGDVAQCALPLLAPARVAHDDGRRAACRPTRPGALAIANTATASSDTSDADAADNTATSSITTAAPLADIATTKTAGAAVAGGQVTYTVTVDQQRTVGGRRRSRWPTPLPAGLIPVSAVSSRGTCTRRRPWSRATSGRSPARTPPARRRARP